MNLAGVAPPIRLMNPKSTRRNLTRTLEHRFPCHFASGGFHLFSKRVVYQIRLKKWTLLRISGIRVPPNNFWVGHAASMSTVGSSRRSWTTAPGSTGSRGPKHPKGERWRLPLAKFCGCSVGNESECTIHKPSIKPSHWWFPLKKSPSFCDAKPLPLIGPWKKWYGSIEIFIVQQYFCVLI